MPIAIRRSARRPIQALLLGLGSLLTMIGAPQAAVEISSKLTQNMTCTAGVCSPTAKKAGLNVTDLAGLLASGDVKVTTGALAQDIEIDAALSWTSTGMLTLDAYRAIAFNKAVVVAGVGGLTITTNDGGTGGDYEFAGAVTSSFGICRVFSSTNRFTCLPRLSRTSTSQLGTMLALWLWQRT